MKTMTNVVLAVIVAFALAPLAYAHEGHDHKIMGTVASVNDHQIEVKATDGKVTAITLNDKTKILEGTTAVKAADIKSGARVVVTATGGGKAPFVAKEVKLAAAKATTTAKK